MNSNIKDTRPKGKVTTLYVHGRTDPLVETKELYQSTNSPQKDSIEFEFRLFLSYFIFLFESVYE